MAEVTRPPRRHHYVGGLLKFSCVNLLAQIELFKVNPTNNINPKVFEYEWMFVTILRKTTQRI